MWKKSTMLLAPWEGTEVFDYSEGKYASNNNRNLSKVQVLLFETLNLGPEALCVNEILMLDSVLIK